MIDFFIFILDYYQDNGFLTRPNIMKTANNDKVFSPHLQLPLWFNKTNPGDRKQVMAFLDDRAFAETSVMLSEVFARFSGQPHSWFGSRIAGIISALFSDRMISCVLNGKSLPHHHACVFLETPDQWERIQVVPRNRLESSEMEAVVGTCRKIFGMDCPLDQDDLLHFLGDCLKEWRASLAGFGRLSETGQYPGSADIRFCLSFIQGWLAILDPYEKICVVRDRQSELASVFHAVVRLKNFYENGAVRWESWRKSFEKFTAFQSEIEAHPEAAADLLKLRHVLEMQRPWDDLDFMDDMIARIKPVYERIRDERFTLLQHETLLQINQMIETISELLEKNHARDEIRNMALVELQKIKKAIELDRPGGLISRQREIAEEAFEKAQDIVFSQT